MRETSTLSTLEEEARRFCRHLSDARGRDRIEFARELLEDLGALYASGVRLPLPRYQDEEEQAIENVEFLVQDVRRTMRKIQDSVEPDEDLTESSAAKPSTRNDERDHEAWRSVTDTLQEIWSDRDRVWYVLNPADPNDREGSEASLADLLADVYVDMDEIASAEGPRVQRARHARLSFDRHWGAKVGLLLFVLHELLDRLTLEPDPLSPASSSSVH